MGHMICYNIGQKAEDKTMLGAIIGDIVGSRFEWDNIKSKEFGFFDRRCFFTDDSVMTLAVAKAILDCCGDPGRLSDQAVRCMQKIGRPYPDCGYGGRFYGWIYSDDPKPYNSYGNGAGMRVSAVAWAARDLETCIAMSEAVTAVTHNHPEGIKGAEAIAVATYLALHGATKEEIRAQIRQRYYPLDFTLDEIREDYAFNETCQETIPQAIEAFLESTDFEDAIRNAISIGGDSDTLAACTGAIAEAYYGIPESLRTRAKRYLDRRLLSVLESFEQAFPPKIAE